MNTFLESGCDRCRSHWQSWSDQPILLGQSDEYQVNVYRCEICGSYWEEGIVHPQVIGPDQVKKRLPWLTID
jgi:hypothetical protein